MSEIDPSYRLPRTSDLVMSAVRATIIPWGIKAVWIRMLPLDTGPEGAYLSDESLGEGLGLDAGTVRNYRYELRQLGLARSFPRPGARQYGWVMQLPDDAIPGEHEPRASVRQRAPALARILEVWLIERHPELAPPVTSGSHQPPSRDDTSRRTRSASSARERGVGGRAAPPSLQSEAQLPPAVTTTEGGVSAKAERTTRREKRDPSMSEQLGLPAIELQIVEGSPRSDDPVILAAVAELQNRLRDVG